MGGTRDKLLKKDQELKDCEAQVGEPEIAKLMLETIGYVYRMSFPGPFMTSLRKKIYSETATVRRILLVSPLRFLLSILRCFAA
jgi:hypothetical protein